MRARPRCRSRTSCSRDPARRLLDSVAVPRIASSNIQKSDDEHHMTPGGAYRVGAVRPRNPAILPLGPLIFNIIVFICFALS